MATAIRRRFAYSQRLLLVQSSREAALAAVHIFNNPLITFKTESFIVLMVIAWTYLFHAYYRGLGINYKHFEMKNGRKRYIKIDGQYRMWELKTCLEQTPCPVDTATKSNLLFLIGLRNQIEHVRAKEVDSFLSGRYQACALNYNYFLRLWFGERYALHASLPYSIQFSELSFQQVESLTDPTDRIPEAVRSYVAQFDSEVSDDDFNNERYSYRVLFIKKLTGSRGQADRVIEFIAPDSDLAKIVSEEYWIQKETERPKFRAKEVVAKVRAAGFLSFGMHQHTQIWKQEDAKNPGKGFGTDVSGYWYWYERWIEFLLNYLTERAPETRVSV